MKTQTFLCVFMTVMCHLKGIEASKLICTENNEKEFSYDGSTNDPPHWGDKFPACNTYPKQSPINIITSDTDKSIGPLQTLYYDTPLIDATIVNAGETVVVHPNPEFVHNAIQVGDTLHRLSYFVFRFGSNASQGSGHTIDGQRYPLEVRFLHSAQGRRLGDEDATLSILFKEVESDNPFFNPIIEALPMVSFEFSKTIIPTLKLDGIVSTDPIPVFQYEGALAIPPCKQTAQWFIAKDIQTIGRKQMDEIRKLYSVPDEEHDGPSDPSNCKMMNNYRPLQPLNGRVVYESP